MTVIDVHAHHIPEALLDLATDLVPSRQVGSMTDLDERIADMTGMGVDVQIISPWMGFFARNLAVARRHNDALAESVSKHSARFRGLAAVPMAEPEHAPAELERAVRELGMRGLEIGSSVLGKNLDEPEFGPLFRKAEELGVPMFIHPVNPTLGIERLGRYRLENLIGNVTETAVAAASLIFGGVLAEFPRLVIYLAHGGGSCPYIRGRWDHGLASKTVESTITKLPSAYLESLYYDALVHSTEALEWLVGWVGADHVMLGTDYPFGMGEMRPVDAINATSLTEQQKQTIMGGAAAELFGV